MNSGQFFIMRSGAMPLLLLCLLMRFHRDVPVDVAGLVEI